MDKVLRWASKIPELPVLKRLSPSVAHPADLTEKEGFLAAQKLARRSVIEVAKLVKEGWTEKQAASLIETYLRDHGVKSFFHFPFVWYGERARFDGIRTYKQFSPSDRVLLPGESFILDVAPILNGYICDIGYTTALGPHPVLEETRRFLHELRDWIPGLFTQGVSGGKIWELVDDKIKEKGFDNIHKKYPFSVLGHRVHRNIKEGIPAQVLNFGWQSYWSLVSRGLFGQLLNTKHEGDLTGLWAVEPHLGKKNFGAKFEEILVVEKGTAKWLDEEALI